MAFRIKFADKKTIKQNFKIFFSLIAVYAVFFTILLFFVHVRYSENFFKTSGRVIAINTVDTRIGENNLARRLLNALDKKKIRGFVLAIPECSASIPYINFPIKILQALLYFIYRPDYTIVVTHFVRHPPYGEKIMFINIPIEWLDTKKYDFSNYRNFIDINRLGNDAKKIDEVLDKYTKGDPYKVIGLTVPVNKTEYKPCNFKKLALFGGLTGKGRNSYKYKYFLEKLDEAGVIEFYGFDLMSNKNSYKGLVDEKSLLNSINDSCAGLVIHSFEHIEAEIPTTRVMEVAAASALIISDQNPFVKKYFSDSALYFDHTKSADEIYLQIMKHLKWIKQNPDEAEKMRKRSHQIFVDNFTAEKFIDEVDKIMTDPKKNKK